MAVKGNAVMKIETIEKMMDEFIFSHKAEIVEVSDYIGRHPEISSQEFATSQKLAKILSDDGFEVKYPFLGIPTAFKAVKKNGVGAKIAIMAEYDALPEIGHACGHNLHGTMSVYAAMALSRALDSVPGEVHLIGTPAEECEAEKVRMCEEGVFDDYDLAIMFHSFSNITGVDYKCLAMDGYTFEFRGRTSHASASPWLGHSAQNGLRLFMDAIDMMRFSLRDGSRIHGIVTKISGATNIVPDYASCRIEFRGTKRFLVNQMLSDIELCAKGAAMATKTSVQWEKFMYSCDDMLPNAKAENLAEEILNELGVKCSPFPADALGSTDVGNVSYRCPTLQPYLKIISQKLDLHTKEFAESMFTEEAHQSLITGVRALARISLRVMADEKLRAQIYEDFKNNLKDAG